MNHELLKKFKESQNKKHHHHDNNDKLNQLMDDDVFLILHKREAQLIKHLLIREKNSDNIDQKKLKVINNLINLMSEISSKEFFNR